MTIDSKQLEELVIKPSLSIMTNSNLKPVQSLTNDIYRFIFTSNSAINLILGTCAVESDMGTYLAQIKGNALGIYQMEPSTMNDILNRFENLNFLLPFRERTESMLIHNLMYATMLCRIKYYLSPEPLPHENDISALASYWKKYYNTPLGKGKEQDFIDKYKKYVTHK